MNPTENNNASLENPTRDYLHSYFKKTDLQKHCREIGIDRVWVTKEELINQIMERHRSLPSQHTEESVPQHQQEDIMKILKDMKERMNIRDLEIDELNDHLKAAHVTINKLSDRISTLEEQVKHLQGASATTTAIQPDSEGTRPPRLQPQGTLLLGDDNLNFVRPSDLHSGCSIRTIKEANVDLIKCWVEEKLSWTPKSCILYCGFQDIFEGCSVIDVLDKLGSLITSLKQLNENMEIQICELVPALNAHRYDEQINNFNTSLVDWSHNNGVSLITTNLQFRLGTGELDHMCYQIDGENSYSCLNRFGIIRLLNVISNQCPSFDLHEDWDIIMTQATTNLLKNNRLHRKGNQSRQNFTSRENRLPDRPVRGRREENHHPENEGQYYQHSSQSEIQRQNQPRDINTHRKSYQFYRPERPSQYRYEDSEYQSHRRTCSNCGETNHQLSECRHKYKIRCNICKRLGHKTRLCPTDV